MTKVDLNSDPSISSTNKLLSLTSSERPESGGETNSKSVMSSSGGKKSVGKDHGVSSVNNNKSTMTLSGSNKNSGSGASSHDKSGLKSNSNDEILRKINSSLFLKGSAYFPLKISVNSRHPAISTVSKNLTNVLKTTENDSVNFLCSEKISADSILSQLLEKDNDVTLDYSGFISHPGTLFVKNFGSASKESIHSFFVNNCRYKSLIAVDLFDNSEEPFAILRFNNHLDVDLLLNSLELEANPFSPLPLYINRYISRKERKLKDDDSSTNHELSSSNVYDTIVLEDLDTFFAGHNLTVDLLRTFFSKFEIFNSIDSIFLPLNSFDDSGDIEVTGIGFVSFRSDSEDTLNENVLKCLYYLHHLTFDQVMQFDKSKLYDIVQDLNKDETVEQNGAASLKISIAQHKHNHLLYLVSGKTHQAFIYNQPGKNVDLRIGFMDLSLHNSVIAKFSKPTNFQETNIYVNNFAVIFENKDALWERFWNQFGHKGIKSAKIIKPQYYNRKNEDSIGKIGFVFYGSFKMAVRAILLTNNKTINCSSPSGINHTVTILTSFALQKNNTHHNYNNYGRTSLPMNYYPVHNSSNNYMKRFSLPVLAPQMQGSRDEDVTPSPPGMMVGMSPSGSMSVSPSPMHYYNPYVYYNFPVYTLPEPSIEEPMMPYIYPPYYQYPIMHDVTAPEEMDQTEEMVDPSH